MNKLFAILPLMATALVACEDLGDRSYYSDDTTTNENVDIRSVNESSLQYLQSRQDLSSMTELLLQEGVFTKLETKGQLHTLLVVTNDHYAADPEDAEYLANSHVTDIAVSPSKLNDGDRLLMWHGKYVTISYGDATHSDSIIDNMMFNNASLKEVIKTSDGYIYVISEMITSPQGLQDYINDLDDSYSIFKEMVTASGGKTFDKANSKPVGVDNAGNTVYDSVFIYTNDFFDAKNFNLSSESLKATMFAFSNDVINRAMAVADSTLRAWGYRKGTKGEPDYVEGRSDSILQRWILEVAFYNKMYTVADLTAKETEDQTENDLSSIYNRQWRTSVQGLDLTHPTTVSNGIIYNVTRLKIPNNMLIYRLKEWFYYYDYCTAAQKDAYFQMDNQAFSEVKVGVDPWTPLAGVWPLHEDKVLILSLADKSITKMGLTFVPLATSLNDEGRQEVSPMLVPPGTYRFAIGFTQTFGVPLSITLCEVDGTDTIPLGTGTISIDDWSKTTYHYDRGATLTNTYPENYQAAMASLTDPKKGNYDTDGGPVLNEVEIQDVKGDGSAVPIVIRITSEATGSITKFTYNHWCLRPTVNNY